MRRNLILSLVIIVAVAALALGLTVAAGNKPALGLDLQGGASVVLQPKISVDSGVLDQAIEIIRNRVDALGVAEPEITRQGDSILVELPGVKDQDRALELVGQTAELRFRPTLQNLPPDASQPVASPSTSAASADTAAGATTTVAGATTSAGSATTAVPAAGGDASASTTASSTGTTVTVPTQVIPTTPADQDDPGKEVVLEEKDRDGTVVARYQLGPAALTGAAVQKAEAQINPNTGEWTVHLTMKSGQTGIDGWNQLATRCYNRDATCPTGQIAIVLDSVVKSAPVVQTPTFERDQIQITGNFTQREAKNLALVLNYGALPVPLEPQAVQTVSASLGEDSLRAGVVSGIIGLLLVVLFMLVYYRRLGLVVPAGLLLSGALLWSIVSYLGETRGLALTLAGITGIIVSIGVTVDSYVVYFERLKDDVRLGRTLRSSAERGFSGAYRTILAADSASLIGAAILWYFTVGSVRGFAFFLGLATILDMVVSFFFTRPAVILLSRSKALSGSHVLGVDRGEAMAAEDKPLVGASR
jgi:preprotein translocase subunit SecD